MIIDRIVGAAVGGLLAVAVVAAGVQTVRLSAAQRTLADLRTAIAEEHARESAAAAAATEAARNVERARALKQMEIVNEAQDRKRVAGLGAAAARVAGDGLRLRAAAAAASCGATPGDPPAAISGPPATHYADMLADVLGRVGEQAVELAAIADAASIAGQACERAYDALTPNL